ncbi:MAG TPA: hypothetical protein VFT04_01590 [Gemmatimonadales bacterium]|nr:hypothetical protein [Gemmatimonadales bacterium]
MTQRWLLAAALTLAACGGNAASSVAQNRQPEPAADAEAAVQQFMEAVADSNLAKMAELWGTAKGSAARTGEPNDFERRIVIMQAYLRDRRHRLMSNTQDGNDATRRIVQVEFRRGDCVKMVPITVVRSEPGAWLVNSIDLALLGGPAGQCDEDADG